jgi:DNA-binding response OmpR family regulator
MADKILIIDDDPILVELTQYNLEAEGYESLTSQT